MITYKVILVTCKYYLLLSVKKRGPGNVELYSIALVVAGVILWDVDDQMQLENGADVVSSIRYKKQGQTGNTKF